MKYVTTEGLDEKGLIQAGKARMDVLEVANRLGYETLVIPTKNGVRQKKYQKPAQFFDYLKNAKIWDRKLSRLKDGDTVLLQYAIMNTALNFHKVIEKHAKRLNFIVLIHDIESIRFNGDKTKTKAFIKRINDDDRGVLISAKKVISHNKKMTEALVKLGVKRENIINLNIFDYIDHENKKAKVSIDKNIIIAGNLILEKSKYLKDLKKLKDVKFNLYGINFDESCRGDNIDYKGAFKPDELVKNLEGSFGLVWDGDSIKTCSGLYGNYLKFNNPHKLSLYLSSGLPVIVWRKSALAQYVDQNNLGIVVNSLEELNSELKKVTPKKYAAMLENVHIIQKNLKAGKYLEKAIIKAEK